MDQVRCCGLPVGEACRCHTDADMLARAVHSFVSRRVRDRSDVDDITQEALLRLYRNVHTLRDAGALEGWAFQIARSAIADHYRRPVRRALPIDPGDAEALLPAVDDLPGTDRTEELAGCVSSLLERVPEGYRRALELTDVTGLTQKRAAAELGLTTSGMKSRVQRGRRLLREEVERCCRVALDSSGGLADLTPTSPTDDIC
jgi:RNA polymerase sigma-70 factor, ECF subfamily